MRELGLTYPDVLSSIAQFFAALRSTPPDQVNLLVIDQFEELFSQSDQSQANMLIEMLSNLPTFDETHTHIIATLRVDYFTQVFNYPALFKQVKVGVELWAMTKDELKAVIQHPLQLNPEQPGYIDLSIKN